jgi:hypothetical protein
MSKQLFTYENRIYMYRRDDATTFDGVDSRDILSMTSIARSEVDTGISHIKHGWIILSCDQIDR